MEEKVFIVADVRKILLEEPYFIDGPEELEKLQAMSDTDLLGLKPMESFKMDSLDMVEFVLALEQDKGVSIRDEAIDYWADSEKTIGNLLEALNKYKVDKHQNS